MRFTNNKNSEGLFKSIFFVQVVLILHLLLLAALGILVAFLSGVMQYMLWVLLGGMALVALSAFLIFRRLRREGKTLGEALRSPTFEGRAVEVSLLGGLATFKLGKPKSKLALENDSQPPPLQLEDSETARIREIKELAQLLEKEYITPEEFAKAKQRLLGT